MKSRYIKSHKTPKSPNTPSSSDEYEEEINDKLNDLWSSMKRRKNQIIRSVVPSYSRKHDSVDSHSHSYIDSKEQRANQTRIEEIEAEFGERLEVA